MKFTELELLRSPGLRHGFKLDKLAAGINVIVGPNASGKTSLARAVRALLWEAEPFRGEVRAKLEHEGQSFDLARETGLAPSWAPREHPSLPEPRFRHCFTLSVDDFLTDKHTDGEIAREIKKELSAGFDLGQVMEAERSMTPQRASSRAASVRKARQEAQRIEDEQSELAAEERGLALLEEERDAAREARDKQARLDTAVELAQEREDLNEVRSRLSELPAGMEGLRGDELERLTELRGAIAEAEAQLAAAEVEVRAAGESITATGLSERIAPETMQLLADSDARLDACERNFEAAHAKEAAAAASLSFAQKSLFALTDSHEAAWVGRERWDRFEGKLNERDAARIKLYEARAASQLAEPAAPSSGTGVDRKPLIAVALIVVAALIAIFALPMAWAVCGAAAAYLVLARRKGGDEASYHERRAAERRHILEDAEAAFGERERELRACCEQCGLSGELATLSLTEIAAHMKARVEAARDFEEAQAASKTAQAACARELEQACVALSELGVEAVRNLVELRHAKDGLKRRDFELKSARESLAKAVDRVTGAKSLCEKQRAGLARFYADTGIGAEEERDLERRLEAFDEFKQLRQRHSDSERRIETLEARLAGTPELLELDLPTAIARRDENAERITDQHHLVDEISRIKVEVTRAREGNVLEDAQAAERQALEALEEVRDELFEGAAAEFLLDSVQAEHRAHAEFGILRRASDWFSRFTSRAYTLGPPRSAADDVPGFCVHETAGGQKLVSELSSGTLAQLQLALRLAVAQESERGAELPIFLDEALSNADPVRFAQVAASLGELARAGRQVFFLASSPDDVQRLSEALRSAGYDAPQSYDLAELVGERAAAASLASTPLPEVPAPRSGEDAAAYGKRLHVPDLDPFLGVDAMHLYYAFTHDLGGLHALLAQRVTSVGQARELLSAREQRILDASQRERFEATRLMLAAWFDAYKIGRGRQLHSTDLREGPVGKLTQRFVDAVLAINAELGGDARGLIAELRRESSERDKRLKGFRGSKIDELEADLEERGCYSPEDPLSLEELRERALAAADSWIARDVLVREDVFQLTNALAQWLGAS